MKMLGDERIAAAGLHDWRKLCQGLHARFLVGDLAAAAGFLAAIAEAAPAGHAPRVGIGPGHVDLKVISRDAEYTDEGGVVHRVEWVTERDLELASIISDIASEHGLSPDPAAVSTMELGLDANDAGVIAPVWAALLTGDPASEGRGCIDHDIRDETERIPVMWFGEASDREPRQRVHLEVYVAPEAVGPRVAAALAAGARLVDDASSPSMTVLEDQEGNVCVLCSEPGAAPR